MKKKGREQKAEGKKQKKKKWKVSFKIPKFLIPKDEPIVPRAFTTLDYAGGIVVFFICWAVYLHTLTPTIGFHDSGDMITAAYVLGIPHPTGYPLYCLLGKLWMIILPIGNIAYRMNMASALCASLACLMVYFIVLKVGAGLVPARVGIANQGNGQTQGDSISGSLSLHQFVPAAVAALMLAFATTFWEQAVIAEKYTLNALFATLLIFILLKWAEVMNKGDLTKREKPETRNPKPEHLLYLFAFTLGLSFTHHMQTLYLVPASIFFIIAVWWKNKKHSSLIPNPSSFVKMLCLFILPLFLYLYLPIRASQNPVYNWGDPKTLGRFIDHITGYVYKGYFTENPTEIYKNLSHIPHFLMDQFTQYFWWISLIGCIILLLKKRIVSLFLLLIIIVNILCSIRYSIPNIEDYYILSYIVFSLLLSLCMIVIVNKILQMYKKIVIFLFSILFFIFPIISFVIHYPYNSRNEYYFAYDYGNVILSPIDEKAIIFLENDITYFPICYLKYCENQQKGVVLISTVCLADDWIKGHEKAWYSKIVKMQHPDLDLSIPIQSDKVDFTNIENSIKRIKIKEIISNKSISRSVFLMYDKELADNYILIPKGIFYKIIPKEIDNGEVLKELEESPRRFLIRGIKDNNMIFKDAKWTLGVIVEYLSLYNIKGKIYYNLKSYKEGINNYRKALAIEINDELVPYFIPYGNFYHKVLNEYKKIREDIRIHLAEAYWSYGNYYKKKGLILKAIELYKRASKIDSNNIKLKNLIGYLYIKKNRYQEAINEFKKAIEIDPNSIKPRINIATIYYEKGLFKEAISECKCILKIDPNNTYAKQMLEAILKRRLNKNG